VDEARRVLKEDLDEASRNPEFAGAMRRSNKNRWRAWTMLAVFFGVVQLLMVAVVAGVLSLLPAQWLSVPEYPAGCTPMPSADQRTADPTSIVLDNGAVLLCGKPTESTVAPRTRYALIFLGIVLFLVIAEYATRPSKLETVDYPQ